MSRISLPSGALALACGAAAMALSSTSGCGPTPEETLAATTAALDHGEVEASQELFRKALDRHPDHVELLVFAADFYLDPARPDDYKPRLSIHYANRAHQAADEQRTDAAAALVRALRAMDQGDEAGRVLSDALALNPQDPELLSLRLAEPSTEATEGAAP